MKIQVMTSPDLFFIHLGPGRITGTSAYLDQRKTMGEFLSSLQMAYLIAKLTPLDSVTLSFKSVCSIVAAHSSTVLPKSSYCPLFRTGRAMISKRLLRVPVLS